MESNFPRKLNLVQLNLIKSIGYLQDEKELNEIDALINFYLEKKLDAAIDRVEREKNYTEATYEQWLHERNTKNSA